MRYNWVIQARPVDPAGAAITLSQGFESVATSQSHSEQRLFFYGSISRFGLGFIPFGHTRCNKADKKVRPSDENHYLVASLLSSNISIYLSQNQGANKRTLINTRSAKEGNDVKPIATVDLLQLSSLLNMEFLVQRFLSGLKKSLWLDWLMQMDGYRQDVKEKDLLARQISCSYV